MHFVSAAILGIIQGLTEFLPISSSAHLILVPWLIGWKAEGLAFDVALHVGTSVSVLTFFWKDWVRLAKETVSGILERRPLGNPERKLAWLLIVATVPAAAAGLLFEDAIRDYVRSPLITVFTLTAFGILLLWADRRSRRNRTMDTFTWSDSIWIGISQAVALIPGVSRSGITMTAALFRDSDRTTAARFSFLLSTPVIVGAGILELYRFAKSLLNSGGNSVPVEWGGIMVGFVFAAVTGFLCIRFFLQYLQSRSFKPFVFYRIVLALIVLIYYFNYHAA